METEYIAHRNPENGKTQSISEHLNATAEMASRFAACFGAASCAYRCGLLHDIGKGSASFQRRISGANIRVDHSTAGAIEAMKLGDLAAALSIAGHHGGIPDLGTRADTSSDSTMMARSKRRVGAELEDYTQFSGKLSIPEATLPDRLMSSQEDAFFYTHMLFSSLVDADWLDTDRFMSDGWAARGTGERLAVLSDRLDAYVAPWLDAKSEINIRRSKILCQLTQAGQQEKGLYTLTVPTGGGKTVSSMAFALRHALCNGQRRIIYVIPYTSIIEQTQGVFEDIFGADNVVAHYANVSYSTDENGAMNHIDRRRYLACENWDAPIILTTAVQFFESLFSNKPSHCRKLHNIADSVVVFDEAQTLPVNYLRPCIWAVTELVKSYGCTAVLCTATQPALDKLIRGFYPKGTEELCPNTEDNHRFFRRVSYKREGLLTDDELVERLSALQQVLCVVNSRKQAQKLYSGLPAEGSFHLSTTMYPAHRRQVLAEIKTRLKSGETCRVISTSLIEAGVDLDFPCVYRAVAGLDSIIQAAGRCNRENSRSLDESVVHIFDTEAKAPRSLRQNIAAARQVLERYSDIASPEAVEAYFDCLLYKLKDGQALDEKGIMRLIGEELAFDTVAKKFHVIENACVTVHMPLGEGAELMERLEKFGPSRSLLRRLGQYSVSVYERDYMRLEALGAVKRYSEDSAVLLNLGYYDRNTGLSLLPEGGEALFG